MPDSDTCAEQSSGPNLAVILAQVPCDHDSAITCERCKTHPMSIRLPEHLYVRAAVYANRNDLSVAQTIRRALTTYLNEHGHES